MKNNVLRRALTVLFTVFFLFSSFTGVVAYAETENAGGSDIYYCREALKALPNFEALIYAYDSIVSGVEDSAESISVINGDKKISVDEIKVVLDAYTRDHTEQFWLGKSYSVLSQANTVTSVKLTYTLSGDELAAARVAFNSAIEELTSYVNDGMSDYEKEVILHDALAARVTYTETEHAHDAYGALVEGRAVCEGYAEALQCLLHAVKIQSLIATGSSVNPSTNSPEGHAWNIVRIDGDYYHTDLTWNDQDASLYHAYFNLSDSLIKEDHTVGEAAFALPVCNSYTNHYFVKNSKILEEYNAELISNMLIADSLLTSVYISDSVNEFVAWFENNIRDIASKIGVTGAFSYGYQKLGREVIIYIEACLHDSLTFVPEKETTCTDDGNLPHYVCTCGRYFLDSEANDGVLSPTSLFFSAYGHNFEKSPETDEYLRSVPETCISTYTYWDSCTRCGKISDKEFSRNDIHGPHTPGEPATFESAQTCTLCNEILAPKLHTHSAVLVPEKSPSCTENGKKAYYLCECGKGFIDAEGTKELLNPDNYGNIKATGHGEPKNNGRCPECGELLEVFNKNTVKIGIGAGIVLLIVIVFSTFLGFIRKKD